MNVLSSLNRKEKFTLCSDHNGSLLRRQPGALIKCAFVEGMHDPAYLFWSHKVHAWLQGQALRMG